MIFQCSFAMNRVIIGRLGLEPLQHYELFLDLPRLVYLGADVGLLATVVLAQQDGKRSRPLSPRPRFTGGTSPARLLSISSNQQHTVRVQSLTAMSTRLQRTIGTRCVLKLSLSGKTQSIYYMRMTRWILILFRNPTVDDVEKMLRGNKQVVSKRDQRHDHYRSCYFDFMEQREREGYTDFNRIDGDELDGSQRSA